MFVDPLGQCTFDIPLGWAYDITASHLITVIFKRPEALDDRLAVQAMPTLAGGAGDDEWYARAAERFPAETQQARLPLVDRIAFLGDTATPVKHVKALVVRGVRIDLLVQHVTPSSPAMQGLSPLLSRFCGSLTIPTDTVRPELVDQAVVGELLRSGQDASRRGDRQKASLDASAALAAARSVYLSRMTALFPEVPAVLAMIDALILKGHADADLVTLRDADLLVSRGRRTVEGLPPQLVRRGPLFTALGERHDILQRMQAQLIANAGVNRRADGEPLPMQRAWFFLGQAATLFEQRNTESALRAAERAVDDMLLTQLRVLSAPAAAVSGYPTGIRAKFAALGLDPADEHRTGQQLANRLLLADLAYALRTLGSVEQALGDQGLRDAAQLLVAISQSLDRGELAPGGHLLRQEGFRRHLAAALLDLLEQRSSALSASDVAAIRWQLDDVEMMLDQLKEGSVLRVRHRLLRQLVDAGGPRQLSTATLETLAEWALGSAAARGPRRGGLPPEAVAGGPADVIAWALDHLGDSDAVDFWRATAGDGTPGWIEAANELIAKWLVEPEWRHGWAIAALRALDDRQTLEATGRLYGIEYARACLVQRLTLADPAFRAAHVPSAAINAAPTFASSPFGDPIVRDVLDAIDVVVAAQEDAPSRLHDVVSDMRASAQRDMQIAQAALDTFPPGTLFAAAVESLAAGSAVALLLRRFSEEREQDGGDGAIASLNSAMIRVAARYGFTSDFVAAAGRAASVTTRIAPHPHALYVLEHLRLAAIWLGDADSEASCNHAVALVLREGVRRAPGLIDAIAAFQRATTLRDQIGDPVAAAGSLIDLSALLIGHNRLLQMIEEGREWPHFANRYLIEAMARLTANAENPAALVYLGEAFQNRARLRLDAGDKSAASADAAKSIALARAASFKNLETRARQTLALAGGDADASALDTPAAALLDGIREEVVANLGDRSATPTRRGLFSTVVETLLDTAVTASDTVRVAELLLSELESARGYTYNRWLGGSSVPHLHQIERTIDADASRPIIAVYVVGESRAALIVIDSGQPLRLVPIDLAADAIESLVETHLRGLVKQGRLRGQIPWSVFQRDFIERAIPLVAPLEPYVRERRPICLVPHRALHAAALHTVPTSAGGEPIGLRTAVFSNPSLMNWLTAREVTAKPVAAAFVGRTSPEAELHQFDEAISVAAQLKRSGLEVVSPAPADVDLAALARPEAWSVLHLSSHGVFDAESLEMGLLLAHDGRLPPPPEQPVDAAVRKHLARPNDLRAAGVGARLAFLASCVSSRNDAYPGDDLMGVTRAWFAGGTGDLVAGAWTVLSSTTGPFADRFYQVVVDGGSVADAMLAARQTVAASQADPFFWGAFTHQGANGHPLARRGRSVSTVEPGEHA